MRRIVVDARAFSDAMAKVSRVLKKSPLPILGEICVSVRDGICTLTATDLETWITARLPVQGDDLTFVFNRTKDVMKALAHMDGELVMELTERAENSKEPQKLRLYCAQRLAEYEVMVNVSLYVQLKLLRWYLKNLKLNNNQYSIT